MPKYLLVKYPDGLKLTKEFKGRHASLFLGEAQGFYDFIGCETNQTDKRCFEKHKNNLGLMCEQCRESVYEYVNAENIRFCKKCATELSEASKIIQEQIQER